MFSQTSIKRLFTSWLVFALFGTNVHPPAYAQEVFLPAPGKLIGLSQPFQPPVLKGIKVDPQNPLKFDFILDPGQNPKSDHGEIQKLIRYFLAALTTPGEDVWVNLSPYEKDRIVPEAFGLTEMGRDLLAEDYLLKQLAASLVHPDKDLGKKFWTLAQKHEVKTFHKVWIVPQKAVVYENVQTGAAFIADSALKVMLDADYLAAQKQSVAENDASMQAMRELIIPNLTQEVNEGAHFAQLRQIYSALILATWYKKKLKGSVLNKTYAGQNKIEGIAIDDKAQKERIYQQYLKAFKRGAFNLIKEEPDQATGEVHARKYFSGGVIFGNMDKVFQARTDAAMLNNITAASSGYGLFKAQVELLNQKTEPLSSKHPLVINLNRLMKGEDFNWHQNSEEVLREILVRYQITRDLDEKKFVERLFASILDHQFEEYERPRLRDMHMAIWKYAPLIGVQMLAQTAAHIQQFTPFERGVPLYDQTTSLTAPGSLAHLLVDVIYFLEQLTEAEKALQQQQTGLAEELIKQAKKNNISFKFVQFILLELLVVNPVYAKKALNNKEILGILTKDIGSNNTIHIPIDVTRQIVDLWQQSPDGSFILEAGTHGALITKRFQEFFKSPAFEVLEEMRQRFKDATTKFVARYTSAVSEAKRSLIVKEGPIQVGDLIEIKTDNETAFGYVADEGKSGEFLFLDGSFAKFGSLDANRQIFRSQGIRGTTLYKVSDDSAMSTFEQRSKSFYRLKMQTLTSQADMQKLFEKYALDKVPDERVDEEEDTNANPNPIHIETENLKGLLGFNDSGHKPDLSGAKVAFIGTKSSESIIEFTLAFPRVAEVHLFDGQPESFLDLERDINLNHFKLQQACALCEGLPKFVGHYVDLFELPEEEYGNFDVVFLSSFSNAYDVPSQFPIGLDQINKILRPDGILYAGPLSPVEQKLFKNKFWRWGWKSVGSNLFYNKPTENQISENFTEKLSRLLDRKNGKQFLLTKGEIVVLLKTERKLVNRVFRLLQQEGVNIQTSVGRAQPRVDKVKPLFKYFLQRRNLFESDEVLATRFNLEVAVVRHFRQDLIDLELLTNQAMLSSFKEPGEAYQERLMRLKQDIQYLSLLPKGYELYTYLTSRQNGKDPESLSKKILGAIQKGQKIFIEIGSGNGANALALAQKNPDIFVLAIDPYVNHPMGNEPRYLLFAEAFENRALDAQVANLPNLAVVRSTSEITMLLPDASIGGLVYVRPTLETTADFFILLKEFNLLKKLAPGAKIAFMGSTKLKYRLSAIADELNFIEQPDDVFMGVRLLGNSMWNNPDDPKAALFVADLAMNSFEQKASKFKNLHMAALHTIEQIDQAYKRYQSGGQKEKLQKLQRVRSIKHEIASIQFMAQSTEYTGLKPDLEGAKVVFLNPDSPEDIIAFASAFPKVAEIHIIDQQSLIFIQIEEALAVYRQNVVASATKFLGHYISLLDMPAELEAEFDVVVIQDVEEAFFAHQLQLAENQIDYIIRNGGVLFSTDTREAWINKLEAPHWEKGSSVQESYWTVNTSFGSTRLYRADPRVVRGIQIVRNYGKKLSPKSQITPHEIMRLVKDSGLKPGRVRQILAEEGHTILGKDSQNPEINEFRQKLAEYEREGKRLGYVNEVFGPIQKGYGNQIAFEYILNTASARLRALREFIKYHPELFLNQVQLAAVFDVPRETVNRLIQKIKSQKNTNLQILKLDKNAKKLVDHLLRRKGKVSETDEVYAHEFNVPIETVKKITKVFVYLGFMMKAKPDDAASTDPALLSELKEIIETTAFWQKKKGKDLLPAEEKLRNILGGLNPKTHNKIFKAFKDMLDANFTDEQMPRLLLMHREIGRESPHLMMEMLVQTMMHIWRVSTANHPVEAAIGHTFVDGMYMYAMLDIAEGLAYAQGKSLSKVLADAIDQKENLYLRDRAFSVLFGLILFQPFKAKAIINERLSRALEEYISRGPILGFNQSWAQQIFKLWSQSGDGGYQLPGSEYGAALLKKIQDFLRSKHYLYARWVQNELADAYVDYRSKLNQTIEKGRVFLEEKKGEGNMPVEIGDVFEKDEKGRLTAGIIIDQRNSFEHYTISADSIHHWPLDYFGLRKSDNYTGRNVKVFRVKSDIPDITPIASKVVRSEVDSVKWQAANEKSKILNAIGNLSTPSRYKYRRFLNVTAGNGSEETAELLKHNFGIVHLDTSDRALNELKQRMEAEGKTLDKYPYEFISGNILRTLGYIGEKFSYARIELPANIDAPETKALFKEIQYVLKSTGKVFIYNRNGHDLLPLIEESGLKIFSDRDGLIIAHKDAKSIIDRFHSIELSTDEEILYLKNELEGLLESDDDLWVKDANGHSMAEDAIGSIVNLALDNPMYLKVFEHLKDYVFDSYQLPRFYILHKAIWQKFPELGVRHLEWTIEHLFNITDWDRETKFSEVEDESQQYGHHVLDVLYLIAQLDIADAMLRQYHKISLRDFFESRIERSNESIRTSVNMVTLGLMIYEPRYAKQILSAKVVEDLTQRQNIIYAVIRSRQSIEGRIKRFHSADWISTVAQAWTNSPDGKFQTDLSFDVFLATAQRYIFSRRHALARYVQNELASAVIEFERTLKRVMGDLKKTYLIKTTSGHPIDVFEIRVKQKTSFLALVVDYYRKNKKLGYYVLRLHLADENDLEHNLKSKRWKFEPAVSEVSKNYRIIGRYSIKSKIPEVSSIASKVVDPAQVTIAVQHNSSEILTTLSEADLDLMIKEPQNHFVSVKNGQSKASPIVYKWGIERTLYSDLNKTFDLLERIERIHEKNKSKVIKILDWGCGFGFGIQELSTILEKKNIPHKIYGLSNNYYPYWDKIKSGNIAFVLDDFRKMSAYHELKDFDIIFSNYGLTHLIHHPYKVEQTMRYVLGNVPQALKGQYEAHFKYLTTILAPEGVLLMGTEYMTSPRSSNETYSIGDVVFRATPGLQGKVHWEYRNLPPGGIDLTQAQIEQNMEIKADSGQIVFKNDPNLVNRLQKAQGLTPKILAVEPLTDLKAFLLHTN